MSLSNNWALLPEYWKSLTTSQRGAVVRMLNAESRHTPEHRAGLIDYFRMAPNDRARVKAHLREVGSITPRGARAVAGVDGARTDGSGRPQVVTPVGGMLYPNGWSRILPPIYSKLRSWWLWATGHRQEIETMNDGHLENTLRLLHESTGNLLGKCNSLLGKIHAHMDAQPEIQRKLAELSLLIGALDVDDVYPIYGALASELSMQQRPVVMMDIETIASDIDAAIGNW